MSNATDVTNGNDESQARAQSGRSDNVLASPTDIFLFVSALLLIFLSLIGILFSFWPESGSAAAPQDVSFLGVYLGRPGLEVRLFVLVVVAGALGSFIHVATSAGDYIGDRKLVRSWIYWYLLRMPVGSSLALLIYLLLRGGVLTGMATTPDPDVPPYGMVGLSALAGMFAKKASNKLGEVFETLFRTNRDASLGDKNVLLPVLSKIDPDVLTAGTEGAQIKLLGQNFRPTTRVRIGTELRKPRFISEAELSLQLQSTDLAQARTIDFRVETPGVEEQSDVVGLEIKEPSGG